jgi:ABC-type transport system involved in multi-copper enzyme maturation permease subunit
MSIGSQPDAADKQVKTSIVDEYFTSNPMMRDSLREQRRFIRTIGGLGKFGPKIVIGLIVFFYAWAAISTFYNKDDLTVFYSYVQLVLITIVIPMSTFGAISGERERATWDAIVLTPMSPGQIIVGKLVWRLRLLILIDILAIVLIVDSRSCVSISVSTVRLVAGQFILLCWGLLLCAFGLWVSAQCRKSIMSFAAFSITLLVLLAVVPIVYLVFGSTLGGGGSSHHGFVYWLTIQLNPFCALGDVLDWLQHTGDYEMRESGVYLFFSVVFLWLTHRTLSRLEHPEQ